MLEFKPDENRVALGFHGLRNRVAGCGRQPQNRGHRAAKPQEIAAGNTALLQFLFEAGAEHTSPPLSICTREELQSAIAQLLCRLPRRADFPARKQREVLSAIPTLCFVWYQ